MEEIIKSSFESALMQENLRPISGPKIDPKVVAAGQDMEYSATFEIFPDFDPQGIEGLEIERPVVEITEDDIDTMLEILRTQHTTWNEVERPAQLGDRVTITFDGTIDGEDFPGNKGEEVPVVLGEGYMVKGFEDALIGLSAGAEKTFPITFPDDFPELAGKIASFTVQVKAVAEPDRPELDAAFITRLGLQGAGIPELRQAVKENMERELTARIKTLIKHQIMHKLLEANPIPLPQSMVDAAIDRVAQQANYQNQGEDDEQAAKSRLFEEEARRQVTLSLLISRLVTDNDIKLEEARLEAQLRTMASTYENPDQVLQMYRQHPQLLQVLHNTVLEEQVMDWLLERAQVIDKPNDFYAIMNLGKANNAVLAPQGE